MKKLLLLLVLLAILATIIINFDLLKNKFVGTTKKETIKQVETQTKQQKKFTAKDYFVIGKNNLSNKNYKTAIVNFSKAISLKNDYIEAYESRALAKDKIKDYSGAQKDYEYALYLKSGKNKEKNQENYNKMMEIINRGRSFIKQQKYHDALFEFKSAIESYPQYEEGYIYSGDVNNTLKNYKDAIDNYTKAIKINSQQPSLFLKRANSEYLLEDYKNAINDYNTYLKNRPEHAQSYYKLTGSYIMLEQFEEALKQIQIYTAYSQDGTIKINDFNKWNAVLNKYKSNETTRELYTLLKSLKMVD